MADASTGLVSSRVSGMPKIGIAHEMSDIDLNAVWDNHLDGHPLPKNITAHMSIRGPEILVRMSRATYRWTKQRMPERGRYWHQVTILE